jgi:hypothetical protein
VLVLAATLFKLFSNLMLFSAVQNLAEHQCDFCVFIERAGPHFKNFVNNFADITKAASWIAVVFAATALLITVVLMLRSAPDTRTKLLGAIFVTGLCFAANNWTAYLVGIFIVATLVTELEFLEKLAAIFWNRKEYWEYLIKRASPKDIDRKLEQEVQEQQIENREIQGEGPLPAGNETMRAYAQFERAVLDSLASPNGPLRLTKLHRNIQISGPNVRIVVDAIGEAPGASYIVEVKFARRLREWQRVVEQLSRYANAYLVFTRQRGRGDDIRKILVVPTGGFLDPQIGDIAVLQFDMAESTFTNLAAVRNLFPEWHWKE